MPEEPATGPEDSIRLGQHNPDSFRMSTRSITLPWPWFVHLITSTVLVVAAYLIFTRRQEDQGRKIDALQALTKEHDTRLYTLEKLGSETNTQLRDFKENVESAIDRYLREPTDPLWRDRDRHRTN